MVLLVDAGQPVDTASNGRAPLPWEIHCHPTQMFHDETHLIEVPHTAAIAVCSHERQSCITDFAPFTGAWPEIYVQRDPKYTFHRESSSKHAPQFGGRGGRAPATLVLYFCIGFVRTSCRSLWLGLESPDHRIPLSTEAPTTPCAFCGVAPVQ